MVCRPLRKSAGLLSANLFLRSDASPVGPTRIVSCQSKDALFSPQDDFCFYPQNIHACQMTAVDGSVITTKLSEGTNFV